MVVGADSRCLVIQDLKAKLRQLERTGRPRGEAVFTGIEGLDRLLPEGGVRRGTLVEWLSAGEGSGAGTLALVCARQACQAGGVAVVVDRGGEFYPPAAAAWGIDLGQTIVVHPSTSRDEVWAWDQALRSTAVGVVWGWLAELDDRSQRRLQLAAERGGGIGVLVRPAEARRQPSWAEVRLLVEPLPAARGRLCRVELLACRGGTAGKTVRVELDDEAGVVRVAGELAASAAAERPA